MNSCRFSIATLAMVVAGTWTANDAAAQRIYSGSTFGESQYSGGTSADAVGRAANADGRALDPYGLAIGDYGASSGPYRVPSHAAGTVAYPGGYYYPGGYSGLNYTTGVGYSVGVSGYSGGYYPGSGRLGLVTGVGVGTTYISPPRTVVVSGVYPSRTIMNNSTRGGVVEYTNNGNGYVYTPGRSYQTVIASGPPIFPAMTVVQPVQPATIIETRPTTGGARTYSGSTVSQAAASRPAVTNGKITLMFPKEASMPFSYVLNGTTYSIKPGYSQSFLDDRPWTIEFLRGGNGSRPMRYELREGVYQFMVDENGWDLRAVPVVGSKDVAPPAPSSALLQTPSRSSALSPLPAVPPSPAAPKLVLAPVPSPDL